MTANSPLKAGGGGGGTPGGEAADQPSGDHHHAPGDSKAFLKDLDKKLAQFDGEVESALERSSFKGTSISQHSSEPPHLTIQDSPTRSTPMSELNKLD